MALQIIKNPAQLPVLSDTYYHHAQVEVWHKAGWWKYFGSRTGSVSMIRRCDPADPVIRVVSPVWQGGQKEEWQNLRNCYAKILELVRKTHCDAVVIPLLTAEDPWFPAHIDFKIAVETIQEFLTKYPLDVFLLIPGPERRMDLDRFLSAHYCEEVLPWSSRPFADNEAPFDTFTPAPPEPQIPAEAGSSLAEDLCLYSDEVEDWEDRDCSMASMEEEFVPLAPKAQIPQKNVALFSTGALPSSSELEKLLGRTDAGFSETLLKLIDKSGKKDSEIYNKANISRQHFSKIRNNPDYKPTKPTAIAFAIALELTLDQTEDLIGRAGYRLTTSSKFDLIIMYFIGRGNYNMFDINEALYAYDQSLLGA